MAFGIHVGRIADELLRDLAFHRCVFYGPRTVAAQQLRIQWTDDASTTALEHVRIEHGRLHVLMPE